MAEKLWWTKEMQLLSGGSIRVSLEGNDLDIVEFGATSSGRLLLEIKRLMEDYEIRFSPVSAGPEGTPPTI